MRTISSRHNMLVREFRELATSPDPRGARLLLDGAHLLREARRSGVRLEIVAIASTSLDTDRATATLAHDLEQDGVEVVTVSPSVLDAMSPVKSPSGLVAIARSSPRDPFEVCARAGLILAACDVQDPGNLGSLARAAEAGGASGLLVAGTSASPFSWKALRGSMGSLLRLPVATVPSAADAWAYMREAGLRTVAAVARDGSAPEVVDWSGRVGLLLGGEGAGLDPEVSAGCDERVTIPMAPLVESLNVAVAGGILVYAARHLRTRHP